MAEVQKKPVKIVETVLRDAHQSLLATRMTTEQMLPIVDKMDKVGYHAVECWGGATFDACLRFLKEDPWERLRKLRAGFKNTKLQMLFRGQNILGYNHYADDVVEYFVQKSIANGIDIIRIFDCLNDIRNLETAVKATKKEAGHDGTLEEVFGTGTAAVISPVGELRYKDDVVTVNNFEIGELTQKLYDTLTGIQWGRIPDKYGWTVEVK